MDLGARFGLLGGGLEVAATAPPWNKFFLVCSFHGDAYSDFARVFGRDGCRNLSAPTTPSGCSGVHVRNACSGARFGVDGGQI